MSAQQVGLVMRTVLIGSVPQLLREVQTTYQLDRQVVRLGDWLQLGNFELPKTMFLSKWMTARDTSRNPLPRPEFLSPSPSPTALPAATAES